jgi:hypothetical protein
VIHLYRNADQKYLWVHALANSRNVVIVSRSVIFDTKKEVWNTLKRIAEDVVVNEFLIVDHTVDISQFFRYKQTPIGVMKSGRLYFTRQHHPIEYREMLIMKNYPINDLLYWKPVFN